MKIFYVISLVISLGLFNSCGEKFVLNTAPTQYKIPVQKSFRVPDSLYGTYLAGRVAHMRQNYDIAADYYIKSVNLGLDKEKLQNTNMISNIYLLLASEGRIKDSAEYAKKAIEAGDKNNLAVFILMTDDMHEKRYEKVLDDLQLIGDENFKKTILPLFEAWALVAVNKKDEALKALEKLKQEQSLMPLYYMHSGMINDYYGDENAAFQNYEMVVNDENMPLSFRFLQIIGNFYIKADQKDKIVEVARKYHEQNGNNPMLGELIERLEKTDKNSVFKYIDTPEKGFAEAMFNIGTILRNFQTEAAQLFTSLVLYLNPDLDVARISLGDLYEQMHRLQKAIDEYAKISQNSPVYYVAQLKVASNYTDLDQKQQALETLENLLKKYPSSEHISFRLGELSRTMGNYQDAATFYMQALDKLPLKEKDRWLIYYVLGITYERQKQWDKAEDSFKTALDLSNRHPFVLNYLGYSWLERGLNYNEALYMIFEAHRKDPADGHIIDSLGWALYKMGNYQDAIKALERASQYLPSNAVVFDHLGDVYWQADRKNEARFQWNHALKATEDIEDLNIENVHHKIENGMEKAIPIPFDEPLLKEKLKTLDAKD